MARPKTRTRRDNRTGAIYKDGDGYRAQILLHYDPATGEPVYKKVRAKTHELAVIALEKLQHSARLQPLAAPSRLNLRKYIEEWLETHVKPTKAPKTYAQYRWVLTQHVLPTLGNKPLERVTRRDVRALVAALIQHPVQPKNKPLKRNRKPEEPTSKPKPTEQDADAKPVKTLSRRTIQAAVMVLHTAYEAAVRDGLATSNPAQYVELPPTANKPAQFLTPPEVARLNKALEGSPVRDLIRFMLGTGTRLGEATGLRWQDVDLKRRTVRIAGQLQRIDGQLSYRPTTKTNQDRQLPIPAWLAQSLTAIKGSHIIVGKPDPDGIVFLNPYGRRFDPKFVHARLAEACKAAGLQPIGPHKLRHTAATIALMETGDLHAVQMMLGHNQVALTANLYGHAITEGLRPTLEALGKTVKPSPRKTRPKRKTAEP